MDHTDYQLFEVLKTLRSSIAVEKRIPSYMIFPDKTLVEMATMFPRTRDALETIYGVGKTRSKQYGDPFLEEINRYIDEKKAEGEIIPNYYGNTVKKPNGVNSIEVIVSPVAHSPIVIENFQEIRRELDSFLDFYRNAAYTPENYRQANADRATLNKLKKALQVKNKEIKDICLEPYKSVQMQFKDLIAMIDAPLSSIASFTADIEQVRRDEKSAEIKMFFDENAGELGAIADEVFSSPWFYNSKWENKTYNDYQWKHDIINKIQTVSASIQRIKNGTGKYASAVIAKYVETGSLREAGEFYRKLTALSANEDKSKNESENLALQEGGASQMGSQTPSGNNEFGEGEKAEMIIKLRLNLRQYQILKDYMESNEIEYQIVMKNGELK